MNRIREAAVCNIHICGLETYPTLRIVFLSFLVSKAFDNSYSNVFLALVIVGYQYPHLLIIKMYCPMSILCH